MHRPYSVVALRMYEGALTLPRSHGTRVLGPLALLRGNERVVRVIAHHLAHQPIALHLDERLAQTRRQRNDAALLQLPVIRVFRGERLCTAARRNFAYIGRVTGERARGDTPRRL